MIEWQNESSLFTLRVRGKQWYWVYKLDFKNFTNIITAPKNIGHNKWVLFSPNNVSQSDDYLSSIQLRKQSKWTKQYWSEICGKEELVNMPFNTSFYDTVRVSAKKAAELEMGKSGGTFSSIFLNQVHNNSRLPKASIGLTPLNLSYDINTLVRLTKSPKLDSVKFSELLTNRLTAKETLSLNTWILGTDVSLNTNTSNLYTNYRYSKTPYFDDSSRFFKRNLNTTKPLSIRPIYLSEDSLQGVKNDNLQVLDSKFESRTSNLSHKPTQQNHFMVMKQKRYKRRKSISDTNYQLSTKATNYFNLGTSPKSVKGKVLMTRDNQLAASTNDLTKYYNFFRKNKKRTDETNINVSRRMIRTKRTLVLPAHVNITAITNSYDVIHSWFIPGLGLKMDCIPGRSTHHTFYVDNVGFYYGQCAEVCGRYHHHMPIRICALPFDHFLLWWHHFGLPKYLGNSVSKSADVKYGLRKYVW